MFWLGALLLALLVLSLRLSRSPLGGQAWLLLRVVLPSWRFFEDIELGPQLWVRVRSGETSWGEWQLAILPPQRTASALLLNAAGNHALAQQSVVEQLWSELDGVEETAAPRLVSYQLVQLIAEGRARSLGTTAASSFQFLLGEGATTDADASYVSQEHRL